MSKIKPKKKSVKEVKKPVVSMTKLKQIIKEARTSWMERHSNKDQVVAEVNNSLDGVKHNLICSLLGLRYEYGKWQVADGYGNGMSTITEYVKTIAGPQVQTWLKKNLTTLPQLTEKQITAIKKVYIENYLDELHGKLEDKARAHARNDYMKYAQALKAELKGE